MYHYDQPMFSVYGCDDIALPFSNVNMNLERWMWICFWGGVTLTGQIPVRAQYDINVRIEYAITLYPQF